MCDGGVTLNPRNKNLKVKSRDTIKTPIDNKSEMSKNWEIQQNVWVTSPRFSD